ALPTDEVGERCIDGSGSAHVLSLGADGRERKCLERGPAFLEHATAGRNGEDRERKERVVLSVRSPAGWPGADHRLTHCSPRRTPLIALATTPCARAHRSSLIAHRSSLTARCRSQAAPRQFFPRGEHTSASPAIPECGFVSVRNILRDVIEKEE